MTKRIKILQCIRQGQIGGGESHLLSLVENLDHSVFDPIVLSFTDGPMIEKLKEMDIETHVIPTLKPFDFSKWKAVKKLLQENEIKLVHAHGTRAASNVLWAARSLAIPVIYTIHGWSFHQDQSLFVRNIRIIGEKYLTSVSTYNISVSQSNQKSGKKYLKKFNSIVINNGIDENKFNPRKEFKNIRSELNIPMNALLVLFIARFTSHKQPLALIKAFKNALSKIPNMHLLMVGDGDEKDEAIRLIDSLELKNSITLASFRQDVPDVLASADIFVLPSLWEGLPIGLLEAMSMGKAVIGTKVDGTSEVIKNQYNGILIETKNLIENLENALISIGSDGKKRSEYARNAMKTVHEKYNAVKMTREIETLYLKTTTKADKEKVGKAHLQLDH